MSEEKIGTRQYGKIDSNTFELLTSKVGDSSLECVEDAKSGVFNFCCFPESLENFNEGLLFTAVNAALYLQNINNMIRKNEPPSINPVTPLGAKQATAWIKFVIEEEKYKDDFKFDGMLAINRAKELLVDKNWFGWVEEFDHYELFNEKRKECDLKAQREKEKQEEITKSKSGGCYIATMVYGDYDAPEVMIFRRFRDEVLKKSVAGRIFIRTYYATSPYFVKIFKNSKVINNMIKSVLDKMLVRIDRKC